VEIVQEERPWGRFGRFTRDENTTVKLVYLRGDKRLSMQYHNNRSEFWKVIKGPVKVQLASDTRTLQAGEFDELDIVRLEDDYKR
jgi:mannose-6-phosphate isomerase-like protein (cupin superfamily)